MNTARLFGKSLTYPIDSSLEKEWFKVVNPPSKSEPDSFHAWVENVFKKKKLKYILINTYLVHCNFRSLVHGVEINPYLARLDGREAKHVLP